MVPLWTLRFSGGGEMGASGARLEDMVVKERRSRTGRLSVEGKAGAAALIVKFMGQACAVQMRRSRRVRAKRGMGWRARMTGGHVCHGVLGVSAQSTNTSHVDPLAMNRSQTQHPLQGHKNTCTISNPLIGETPEIYKLTSGVNLI